MNGWLVFLDESGLLLLPVVRRTWSRCGQTPVLRHVGRNLKKVSAIAALCVSPDRREVRLYFQLLVDENFNSAAVLGFVKQLAGHFREPLLLLWDRAKIHSLGALLAARDDPAAPLPTPSIRAFDPRPWHRDRGCAKAGRQRSQALAVPASQAARRS
jgi:DDE superfamily endonuclease